MAVKDLGGGKYQVRVYNPNLAGKQYNKVILGKRAADLHEAEMKVKFARGQILDPSSGKQTFGSYALEAIESRLLVPQTRANYLRFVERIQPIWGHRPLRSLKYTDAVSLTTALRAESDGGSTANVLVLARSIMRQALNDGIIDRNPFTGLKLYQAKAVRVDAEPTWVEVRAATRRPGKTSTQITVLAGVGLRSGECLGLELAGIDWLRRTVTVTQQLHYLTEKQAVAIGSKKSGFYLGPAKTEAGADRTIPVPQFVLDVLAAHLTRHPAVEVTLPWGSPDATKSRTTSLVFGTTGRATMTKTVTGRAKRVGGTWSSHDLRHLYASTLGQASVPVPVRTVQEVMGHAAPGVTARYSHVQPHTLELIRPALEAAWALGAEGVEGLSAAQ